MNNDKTQKYIGVLGAGRQAAETADYLLEMGHKIEFFFCESKYADPNSSLSKIAPIITEHDSLKSFANLPVVSAVGSPKLRKHLVSIWPHKNFFTLVHPSAVVSKSTKLGEDVTVPPMCVINTNTTIGDHVLLNLACTISHDVNLEDYTTLSPGVSVAGVVNIGRGCFLGVGSCVSDHITVGEGVVIAAGSVVVDDVSDSCMVAGVPAITKKGLVEWY